MPRTSINLPFNGALLRDKRERAGLGQQALADRCQALGHKVSRNQISNIELGKYKPSPESLKALVAALGVELDDLLDGDAA